MLPKSHSTDYLIRGYYLLSTEWYIERANITLPNNLLVEIELFLRHKFNTVCNSLVEAQKEMKRCWNMAYPHEVIKE